ncbi:hypothetical protein ACSSS7_000502 [Eimeria intestinalis]
MFADAADSGLDPRRGGGTVVTGARLGFSAEAIGKDANEEQRWITSSLQSLEGVHLLPCHIKYSGQASVSDLFRPTRVQPHKEDHTHAAAQFEVLLHGRWLRGQEQRLSDEEEALQLRGLVVAAEESKCNLGEMRKRLSSVQMHKRESSADVCEDVDGSPASGVALRPCADFNKLCYWQQDREPSATEDVQQSLFFLKAIAAVSERLLPNE